MLSFQLPITRSHTMLTSERHTRFSHRATLRTSLLLLMATAAGGCVSGRREESSAFRGSAGSAFRLEAPALPSTPFAYVANADSALTRLFARGPGAGFQGGRGGGGGPPGPGGPPNGVGGGPPGPGGPPNGLARGPGGGGGPGGGPGGRGGRGGGGGGVGRTLDNTPVSNVVTDAGATLGRVLFYDRQLSVNNRIACASCHVQQYGFGDTARLSRGFAGGTTKRHSMALANARLYSNGRFFWDERAGSLEAQVLMPVQDPVEMGMTLPALETKLVSVSYYAPLFKAAFGTPEITSDRVSRALAQFVRSLVSSDAPFDRGQAALNAQERDGQRLFNGQAGCSRCHVGPALNGDGAHNTGLDATIVDNGAGRGQFKVPSLRNIAVRAPYMHDGRFTTLEQVVDHYNNGVKNNPALDQRLRGRGGAAARPLGLSPTQRDAIVAYMRTLTDSAFLVAPQFSDPFVPVRVAVRH